MDVKDYLAKLLLGGDIHENLAMAEKEMCEANDKYDNACNANDALEKECDSLEKSVNSLTQELKTLKEEQLSLDEYMNLFLKDEERIDAQTVLANRLEEKRTQLLSTQSQLQSSEKERGRLKGLMKDLQKEKATLEIEVNTLNHDIEVHRKSSKQKDEQKAKREKLIDQRKGIRDNLTTLKDEWQNTLDDFNARLVDCDSLKSLEELKRELNDYERCINNAINIPVE
ncbi:MAG: hypothetical protein J6W05_12065 [Prevotella sp.]|nr:hypothetical protein [Prevotella sp.]